METIQDYALRERYKQLNYNMPFLKIFGVRLFKFFPNVILGFDVIKFDQWINPRKNESTYDAIKRKFGSKGVNLIKNLVR